MIVNRYAFIQYPENILGEVVAASRGRVSRNISGGNYGRIIWVYVRMRKQIIIMSGYLLKIAQPVISTSRIVIHQATPGMNPRIILFTTRNFRILRVNVGTHLTGEYHSRKT